MARKPKAPRDPNETLLHACTDGDVARVEEALAAGAQLDPEGGADLQRPLFIAATYGHTKLFRLLLDRGAKLRAAATGETPLTEAATHDHADIVAMCLDVSPDERDEALRLAVGAGAARVVPLLLERGADPNATQHGTRRVGGTTAMHFTGLMRPAPYANGSAATILQALLDRGGDLHGKDADGRTPFHAACGNERAPTSWLDHLHALGARVDDGDAWGMTPLWLAARADRLERVRWLLAHGADPNAKTTEDSALAKAGTSVYEIARTGADLPLLAALRDAGAVTPNLAPAAPAADPLRVGAKVTHPTFGTGTIAAREGAGDKLKLTIEFGKEKKVLLAKFVVATSG